MRIRNEISTLFAFCAVIFQKTHTFPLQPLPTAFHVTPKLNKSRKWKSFIVGIFDSMSFVQGSKGGEKSSKLFNFKLRGEEGRQSRHIKVYKKGCKNSSKDHTQTLFFIFTQNIIRNKFRELSWELFYDYWKGLFHF